MGQLVSAGLPDLTGQANGYLASGKNGYAEYTGVFSYVRSEQLSNITGTNNTGIVQHPSFRASKCNSIYGNSNTVTPASLKVGFYIRY